MQNNFSELSENVMSVYLKAGSYDPIFGSDFFSGIVSGHRNADARQ